MKINQLTSRRRERLEKAGKGHRKESRRSRPVSRSKIYDLQIYFPFHCQRAFRAHWKRCYKKARMANALKFRFGPQATLDQDFHFNSLPQRQPNPNTLCTRKPTPYHRHKTSQSFLIASQDLEGGSCLQSDKGCDRQWKPKL